MKLPVRSLGILAALALAACPPAGASPPAPAIPHVAMAADTAKVTIGTCTANEPTVKCRASLVLDVGGQAVSVPAIADVAVGASFIVQPIAVQCVPLSVVTATVTLRGLNRSGALSGPTESVSATATCSDAPPNVPGKPTLTVTITSGGQ